MQINIYATIVALFLITGYDRTGSSAFQVPFRHAPRPRRPALATARTTQLHVGSVIPILPESIVSSDRNEPHAHEPVILAGTSPQAIRLRKALQEVWNSPPNNTSPVLLVGPPGSGKAELVDELLDRLPSWQKQVVHRLSMDDAVNHIDTMLGMSGQQQQPGLLDLMADQANATLVLTKFQLSHTCKSVDELERRQELFQTISKLVTDRTFFSRYEGKEKTFAPRIIATCSQPPHFVKDQSSSKDIFVVKVPALESRTQDMLAIASAKIKSFEKHYDLENVQLSREANHRLLDHNWEVCASELDQELCAALALLAAEKQENAQTLNVLQPKHMLVNSFNERNRHRLLYDVPGLRKFIQSPWIFDHTLRYIVTPAFLLTLAALFWGPQTRDHNTALTYFWAGWWPAVMLSFPFLGRIWCSICPFMAVGTLAQETVTSGGGVQLRKWPKWGTTMGAPFAFGLFFLILMWEELWNLTQNGTLSAFLLLLITSGAVFNSVQYEKRFWCRYLCPIGAMCRVFGTMSMLEVRSWKANCEGCTDAQCFKGNSPAAKPSDEFAIKGCTIALKNNQLRDMGDVRQCFAATGFQSRYTDAHRIVLLFLWCSFLLVPPSSVPCACLVSRTANEKYPSSTQDQLG
jgi:4Fe-4S binding domain